MIKRNIFIIILFILLFPSIVFAKDSCNSNDIKIKSIILKDTNGFSEEVNEASISNNKINLDLKMYNVGDSIEYDVLVKNSSNEDYYFTSDSFKMNTDYLEYSLLNDSEVVTAGEEKSIQLKITYKNKIPNDSFNDVAEISISLSDTSLINPQTNSSYIFIFVFIIFICLSIYFKKKNINISNQKALIVVGLMAFIPISVYATCNVKIAIESKIEINNNEAFFLPGSEVNVKMKELAGDDTSTATFPYVFQDENIVAIKYSKAEPTESNKEEKNIVSTSDSPHPIYMWYTDGIIYWWSEAKNPYMNENSSYMYMYLRALNDITGIKSFDTSYVTNMTYLFYIDPALTSINEIKDWDVSNVTKMTGMFNDASFNDLSPLKDWDVSKVTNMEIMFGYNTSFSSLMPLKNWDTSSVTTMSNMFSNTGFSSLKGLENWDVSNVTDFRYMFLNNQVLQSAEPIKNWNVSKGENMSGIFMACESLEDITGLDNWDVSSATNMFGLFSGDVLLMNSSIINDWDISNVTDFRRMFRNVPTHPEFSKVAGTWNSEGTFIPS